MTQSAKDTRNPPLMDNSVSGSGPLTYCLRCRSEEAIDNLRQHRVDGERVVSCVRHDGELVCRPQGAIDPGIALTASQRLPELDYVFGPRGVSIGKDQQRA